MARSRSANYAVRLENRQLERRLLCYTLLLVAFGMVLTFIGKLSTTPPLPLGSININIAGAAGLSESLGISSQTASEIVEYRNTLPSHRFVSVYRLRRTPILKNVPIDWPWQRLYVRSAFEVAIIYFSALICLILGSSAVHAFLTLKAPSADPFLFPITVLLSGFGLMTVLTVHDPLRDTFAFENQAAGVIFVGLIALVIPLTRWFRSIPLYRYTYAYALASLIFLALLLSLGHGPAATHIQLFGIEPIEFIKVLLIFFIASYLADHRITVANPLLSMGRRELLPLACIYLFALSLFGAVKDLGPAVLLFGSLVAMLYLVSGNSSYPVLGALLLLAAAYIGDRLGVGFFATRVEMWLHPWNNGNRLGGQLAEGLWGLSTGGVFGSGGGLGGSYFVPRGGSDMAFTTIGEEYGLVGGVCVLSLYVVIIFRGLKIAQSGLGEFERLLAAGISILIGLQSFVITGGATGLIPLTGITLPFVSYGSSSLGANFFCIGLLLSLSVRTNGAVAAIPTPSLFVHTCRRVGLCLSFGLLALVGVVRLVWVQAINDQSTAIHELVIPDADGIRRNHRNPRLIEYASDIPRGNIVDRNGILLACTAPAGQGVPYLTDGTPRCYPLGSTAANILVAVEQEYTPLNRLGREEQLRGYRDFDQLLPLYRRKDLPFPPTPHGENVRLTIDSSLQRVAQESLQEKADRYGNGCGAAVVLDSKSGEVLAAATVPTFDPNTLTEATWDRIHTSEDSKQILLDRALSGLYTPGSVFKLVTATAAFNNAQAGLMFNCNHRLPYLGWKWDGVTYGRRGITDDEDFAPHGNTNLSKAIRVSCNVYFARLGAALGPQPLFDTMGLYGLTERPSVDGLAKNLADCAYGQGPLEVTPMQIARVCQTISNDGITIRPSFFEGTGYEPIKQRVLQAGDAHALSGMMRSVVVDGTAQGVFTGLSVAGKTGSAQVSSGQPHSWFAGFSPVDDPRIAFACIVEHGGHGRTAAASVCRAIVEAYTAKGH